MASTVAARAQDRTASTVRSNTDVRWTVIAPDASTAWFALLAEVHLGGAGAFQFVSTSASAPPRALRQSISPALARSREFEVLHFVPLYYPSANRIALATALRAASATPARAPVPRAELLVAALANAMSADARREHLPALASALEDIRPVTPSADRLALWQRRMDSLFLPALAPWLRNERLDAGRLIVSDAIGPEGRIFAGTSDRSDNLIAVGAASDDIEPDAPIFAYTRELCYPAVTRAARARGFTAGDPNSARRTSLAAVRCGADLLTHLLPAQAGAYRAFWLRRAGQSGETARFDAVFPPDSALRVDVATSLGRATGTPR
jgi:hypothetical protein